MKSLHPKTMMNLQVWGLRAESYRLESQINKRGEERHLCKLTSYRIQDGREVFIRSVSSEKKLKGLTRLLPSLGDAGEPVLGPFNVTNYVSPTRLNPQKMTAPTE